MAKDEILSCSKFFIDIDGLSDLIVKTVSGINKTLTTSGDDKPYGVTKGGVSYMQATVNGVTNGTITIEFLNTDMRLYQWYRDSHSASLGGGGSVTKGVLKNASIILYNQGGEEGARWDIKGIMPLSYKSSKMEADSEDLASETLDFVYQSLHRVK